ncbi:MAG: acylphosphatase [Candidatus Omnitrophica bacterium]|nr:acylphosphatase [Candidatus Omnitrophota bacterium]
MAQERLRLVISGYVQGVFFRAHADSEAKKLGLKGWVRNRADGTVEIVAEGERKALDRLKEWAHHGPPSARVTDVKVNYEPPTDEFENFSVRY